ncbi:MAG: histidine phosphatase family protein [Planctomycetota bacterium]|jgi:probable phosphoglycerate mutase
MILLCVRHGESIYNAEGRVQGQSDVPLSQLGRRQSDAVAKALCDPEVEAIFSSPLGRAMETAQTIAEALQMPVRTDDRLTEVHAGIFQDKLRSELAERYPADLDRWLSGDPDFVIPGGESRRALARRGREALESIQSTGRRRAVVVSHGRLLVETFKALRVVSAEQRDVSLHNGSITTLRFDGDGRVDLLSLDQIDHLEGVGKGGQGDL